MVADAVEDPPECITVLKDALDIYDAYGEIPPIDQETDDRCGIANYLEDVEPRSPSGPAAPEDGQPAPAPPA